MAFSGEPKATAADMDDSVQTVGIVGTGVMGRSIALRVLQSGLEVVLFDSDADAASVASEWVGSRTSASPMIASSMTDLADCDVVIEAVVENRAVKRRVLGNLAAANPSALIATNTSSLSISELAEAVGDAGRFCGLHFCHPIDQCPLVEVVPSPATEERTLRRAEAFVQRLGMQLLLTRDVPGFAVNRLLLPYLDAAVDLVLGGVDWLRIEKSAVDFGMRLGPLSQMDEIGIDVILRAAAAFHRGNPVIPPQSELLLAMYQAGRIGRKAGRGFLDYANEPPCPDPSAVALAAEHRNARIDCPDKEVTLRLFLPMLGAACGLIERQLVPDAGGVRLALVAGLACRRQAADLPGWGRELGLPTIEQSSLRLGLPAFEPTSLERLLHD